MSMIENIKQHAFLEAISELKEKYQDNIEILSAIEKFEQNNPNHTSRQVKIKKNKEGAKKFQT